MTETAAPSPHIFIWICKHLDQPNVACGTWEVTAIWSSWGHHGQVPGSEQSLVAHPEHSWLSRLRPHEGLGAGELHGRLSHPASLQPHPQPGAHAPKRSLQGSKACPLLEQKETEGNAATLNEVLPWLTSEEGNQRPGRLGVVGPELLMRLDALPEDCAERQGGAERAEWPSFRSWRCELGQGQMPLWRNLPPNSCQDALRRCKGREAPFSMSQGCSSGPNSSAAILGASVLWHRPLLPRQWPSVTGEAAGAQQVPAPCFSNHFASWSVAPVGLHSGMAPGHALQRKAEQEGIGVSSEH